METLRLPRGLLEDLCDTIAQQDEIYLRYVARELGLPVREVLQKCGVQGMQASERRSIPVLWMPPGLDINDESIICPWWECHGDGLWRRCPRIRLSSSLPCMVHERCTPCPRACCPTRSDDVGIKGMRRVTSLRDHNDNLWWIDPAGHYPPFREDGTVDHSIRFRRIRNPQGEYVWVQMPVA